MSKDKTIKSGVYSITNLVNGKIYIGGSTVSIEIRFSCHRWLLRSNRHSNPILQRSWNKYGETSFSFDVIERCKPSLSAEREQCWINFFSSTDPEKGFNICPFAGRGMLGRKHSEETISKLRGRPRTQAQLEAMRKPKSDEHKAKLSVATSRSMTPEHRALKSALMKGRPSKLKGRPKTEEHKKNLSASHMGISPSNKGKPMSEEQKSKLRKPKTEAQKDKMRKPKSEEHKAKLSAARMGMPAHNKGKKMSEEQKIKLRKPKTSEHKAKLSVAQKRRWAKYRLEQNQQGNDEGK